MTKALLVALKEIRSYLEDPVALAYSLLLPILIFALTYGALGNNNYNGTASIVNEDSGKYSAMLIDKLKAYEGLTIELMSPAEAERKLSRSDIQQVLYIPQGFSEALAAGQPAQLNFKQRGNGGTEGQITASLVRGAAEQIGQDIQVQQQVAGMLDGKGFSPQQITLTTEKFLEREASSPIVTISERNLGDSPDPVKQFLPGILTMFVLFSVSLTARALVEEKTKGTLERLLTTRLTPGELFTGKFLANTGRAFVQTLILLLLAWAVFRMFTLLSFLAALLLALVFAAATSALGLVIGSICRTENQAIWIAVLFSMIMAMFAGTFVPPGDSGLLYTLSKFSVNTYANEALRQIISSGGLGTALVNIAVLTGVAAAALVLSRFLFKANRGGK